MKVKTQRRTKDADVIIALSFGVRESGRPGTSNKDIAEVVVDIVVAKMISVIAQKEVAEAFKLEEKNYKNVKVIKEHRVKGKYLDTFEVLSQAHEIMKREGWNRAILVAHPVHIPRVKRVLEKMGLTVIIPERLLEKISFDTLSAQWWTRGRLRWWLREIPTRLIYKAKNWT